LDLSSVILERNVLACLLKDRNAWLSTADLLTAEDFTYPLNSELFGIFNGLHDRKAVLDPVLISEHLAPATLKELDGLGGWGYLQDLRALPIAPANVQLVANELHALTIRRRAKTAGERIAELATQERTLESMLSKSQIEIDSISATEGEGVIRIGADLALNIQQKIETASNVPGLSSGFSKLDMYLQGFQSAELYVLAARKKTGKSVTLLTWARNLALKQNIPILYVSTEHHHKLDQLRLLSMEAEVSFNLLNSGMVKDRPVMMERVTEAVGRIEQAPFHFKYLPSFALDKIKRMARKYIRLEGVRAVFFDLIKMPQGQNQAKEWQELGTLAYGLKELAGEEGVPVVSAVQFNREAGSAQRLQEELDSDYFAGSDRIAQALTVAFALRRPYKDELSGMGFTEEGVRILQVTDNRLGPSGYKGVLQFEASTLNLRELQRLA